MSAPNWPLDEEVLALISAEQWQYPRRGVIRYDAVNNVYNFYYYDNKARMQTFKKIDPLADKKNVTDLWGRVIKSGAHKNKSD